MKNFQNKNLLVPFPAKISPFTITYQSPSNLAIVKYWGKYGVQLPRNPSISLTLKNAYTQTTLSYVPKSKSSATIDFDFYFEKQPNPAFKEKILRFFHKIYDIFPFLSQFDFTIHSFNSFPHSAGIASSASSMSALALCLCEMERQVFGTLSDPAVFLSKASFVARLGSGSASRSVYATAALWGKLATVEASSNDYAIPFEGYVHPVFKTFHDDIFIVSKGKKAVSSTAGHALMNDNIYAESRYQQARQRCTDLKRAMETGDIATFGQISEDEALTLHALMMCSNPSYILLKPNSLKMIEKVRAYRADTQRPVYFSFDAGPNLHLLYPDNIKGDIQDFIQTELVPLCEDGQWIQDEVGDGPFLRTK